MRRFFLCMLWTSLPLGWACSPDSAGQMSRGQTPQGAAVNTPCQLENETQPCTCAGGALGRQSCSAFAWQSCTCRNVAPTGAASATAGGGAVVTGSATGSLVDPAANRSTTRFDWQRTMPMSGSCEAGHYEGTFDGIYGPSIIVVADLKVIPVFPIDLPGSPGLAFDLTREGNGEVFTVKNGKMNGNALGAFPFTADIVGKLDCSTMKFDAKLVNGSYFIGPLEFRFEGPILADYDKSSHTLVNGTWKVTEPDYPSAGGEGTWTVHWVHN